MTNTETASDPTHRTTPSPMVRIGATAAAVLGVPAAFPATWWLVASVDRSGDSIVDPDYLIPPPELAPGLEFGIGLGSVVLCLVGVAAVAFMVRRGHWHIGAAGLAFAPFVWFGFLGLSAHVFTAPTIGANIGAGLMFMGAVPVTVLVILGTIYSARHRRRNGATTR